MPLIRLSDPNDPRIDVFRNVPDPDLFVRGGLFVAEGRLVVRRLIEGRRFSVRSVMVTEAALVPLRDLLATRDELTVFVVPQAVMDGITGLNMHRGCLAIGERPRPRQWRDVTRGAQRAIALERIANADNVGSVFRSAAAFGIELVVLGPNTGDPLYRKAVRTSMAATLAVPFVRAPQWPAAITDLRGDGFRVVALTPALTAAPLEDIRPMAKLALLVGSEGEGLTRDALAAATLTARIPMTLAVDSLNVTTAASIAMYHCFAERRQQV